MTTTLRERAADLHKRLAEVSLAAIRAGESLSARLEREDPSAEYKDGLTAIERQLQIAGIATRSDPVRGFWADPFQKFLDSDSTRALMLEWCALQWRKVSYFTSRQERALYLSGDTALGGALNPYAEAANLRIDQLAAEIPIAELVAITTPIEGAAYRAAYLEDDSTQSRLVRVAQSAPLPLMKLTESERMVNLYKYGRALEISYEAFRRSRIDRVALHIARVAIQAEIDKLAVILDVLVNGDGNSGTAATNYNLTTLDSGTTANNLTLLAWEAFKLKWGNPYMMSHFLAQESGVLKVRMLNMGSANVPLLSQFGSVRPIRPQMRDSVAYGNTADAPSGKLVGFDSRFAIERVVEIGSVISESERVIRNQTTVVTLSEVEGYMTFDKHASKTLNLAA